MPLLVINMGGEMVYILEQRLEAQQVPVDKAGRVLNDVLRTMFAQKFVQTLFEPGDIYTPTSTRQIFNKLAHSSIMRLNQSSMDKLYDLMTMGFKYQMLGCSSPEEILTVTKRHLTSMRAVLPSLLASALYSAR